MRRVLILLLPCLACGPDEPREPSDDAPRVAAAICEAANTCACASNYDSTDECEDRYVSRFEDAIDRDMRVHSDCVDDYIDTLAEDPCLDEHTTLDFTCASLRGSRKQGESCSDHSELPLLWAEECDEGLTCLMGVCRSIDDPTPTPRKEAGESCWSDSSLSCGSLDVYCGSDGVCHDIEALGGPCEPFGCDNHTDAGPLYCEGSYAGEIGTCAPIVALEAECDPLDFKPCGNGSGDMFFTCDPSTRTCVTGSPPNLCWLMNYPTAWR